MSGFPGRLLGILLKVGLQLTKNAPKLLPKSVLVTSGLRASASGAEAEIHKKALGSETAVLVISNAEMKGIMNLVKSLEGSGLLLKGVTKTIGNETKEQKGGLLSMLLDALCASPLGILPQAKDKSDLVME